MIKKKNKKTLLIRDGLLSTILSLLVCYLLSLVFINVSFFNPLSKALEDFSFLDVYYSEKLNENQGLDPNIILINIEDENRMSMALALDALLEEKPKVVGFDVLLKTFEKTPADTLLANVLNHKKVISSYVLTKSETIYNHPFFAVNGPIGYVNFNFGYQDAVVREFMGYYESEKQKYKAFAVQIAKKFMSNNDWKKNNIKQKLASSRVINYVGDYEHFMHLTLSEFMDLSDKSIVKGKSIIFGYLGNPTGNRYNVEDKHFTPLNKVTAGKSVPDMYGMVVHANILAMILSNDFMFRVSNIWLLIVAFVCSFLASIYFIWLDKRLKISYRTVRKAVLFVFAILMVWLTLILFKYGVVLKSAPIIAVTVFSAGFVKYYKHLVRYINTKRKFRSYLK